MQPAISVSIGATALLARRGICAGISVSIPCSTGLTVLAEGRATRPVARLPHERKHGLFIRQNNPPALGVILSLSLVSIYIIRTRMAPLAGI